MAARQMVAERTADLLTERSLSTPIVGLGASAGGLVALEQFLEQTPSNSGMAYVVVQHLDPTQKALLPELLQRVTTIPVHEVEQGMRVEPDCVYVIPPNTELSVVNGTLKLAQPVEPRGMRLPVNVLFSSLASALGERAIGVILSGMGSDGTLGMQAIKAVGGLTVVQEPESAQFDSMPKSAIMAGCADLIARPAEMPARILAYFSRIRGQPVAAVESTLPASKGSALEQIIGLLQVHTRHDFSLYKPSTLHRRIDRRMAVHGLATPALYAEFLANNTHEVGLLFKELLIGVTAFFRDAPVWQHLAEAVLPAMLAQAPEQHNLRAWSVGCSTGEEAYSLAMVFSEVAERLPLPHGFKLQVFASDLSADAIAQARRGQYPLSVTKDVSPERLARFFTAHETHYEIKQDIREMVLFTLHDVVLDPPFTRLDLIICRNLLIYFDAQLQRRLLPLFHYSLRTNGVLMLGSSETIGHLGHLFEPVELKLRIYRRQESTSSKGPDFLMKSFPPLSGKLKEHHVSSSNGLSGPIENLQSAADHVLLQVYAPAAVVLNSDGDIVYISGRTGKYLEPAAGKANWNFHAMVRDGLREPLFAAVLQAQAGSEPLVLHGLQVKSAAGVQAVDVTVQALHEPDVLRGMTIIVFRDRLSTTPGQSAGSDPARGSLSDLHALELQRYRNEIQTLREETRASREELQSANEELQSTNEELQSANEELTTSKEEMQSMNEELQTINNELQTKLDDLDLAQSDLRNLLNSIEIAILFLDGGLNVRRYTDRAAKIFSLRESDVGRPLSELSTSLQYADLQEDARGTLRTLASSERQIPASDGRWFTVRVMPYRRLDNVIDGVVITLLDITAIKRLEAELRQAPAAGNDGNSLEEKP